MNRISSKLIITLSAEQFKLNSAQETILVSRTLVSKK